MRTYTFSKSNITPNTSNDVFTLVAGTNFPVEVKRIRVSGESNTPTTMRLIVQRSTAGTTGSGAVTASQTNTSDSAANTVCYTAWSVQPTLSGSPLYSESYNSYSGGLDLVLDGRSIWLRGGEQLSIRNTVGTGTISVDVEISEI